MKLELTKEELQIVQELVKTKREDLGKLNFEATIKEYNQLKLIAPLNFKLKQLCKD